MLVVGSLVRVCRQVCREEWAGVLWELWLRCYWCIRVVGTSIELVSRTKMWIVLLFSLCFSYFFVCLSCLYGFP